MLNRLRTTTSYLRYIDSENLELFADKEMLQSLVENYLQMTIEKARQEGYQEAQKDFSGVIEKKLKLEINKYINLVTKIADDTYNKTNMIFQESLHIVETRTNFAFGTHRIKLLLIIECDSNKEVEFAKFLYDIEKVIFEKNGYFCELLYINKKGIDLNMISISIDYPLVRTRKVKKNKNA